MADIVLTTLNARYAHAAFGLRCLMANLGALQARAAIVEFDISQRPADVVEAILAHDPRIVGIGVYIWNVIEATRVAADLKRLRPELIIVLGGPEVSHETDEQEIVKLADHVVTGEADLAFARFCEQTLEHRSPRDKVIHADLPEFAANAKGGGLRLLGDSPVVMTLPYDLYTDEDLAHRVVYVEASRGCPFKCEFCLSSLDVPVRNAPLDAFLSAMQRLLDRGLNQFKFVDRTFNLNLKTSRAILEFFRARLRPGLFLHFEMIPDRLPEALRGIIQSFPPGALQFEVGIQSFNPAVCARISRRQDVERLEDNLRFLRDETGVHVHADLIVGLPGEDLDSFGRGFDRLVDLRPQEIQVGILKRLRGAPIVRHDQEWGMVYSGHPPYEVLQTSCVTFCELQRMRRFARHWDLVANSGNFTRTAPMLWGYGSPFDRFGRFSEWLFAQVGRSHAIALHRLAEMLFRFLTDEGGIDPREAAAALWSDYRQGGRRDGPDFLRPHLSPDVLRAGRRIVTLPSAPQRQARHLAQRAED